jgi:hypothetical protein
MDASRSVKGSLHQRYKALRPLAIPAALVGLLLGAFGWAASFTRVGAWSIAIGASVVVIAAILRPTWRFLLLCLVFLFCILGGPVIIYVALTN